MDVPTHPDVLTPLPDNAPESLDRLVPLLYDELRAIAHRRLALGINDRGDITGRFCTRTPCREPGSGDFHGFVLRDGEYTIIDVPGSIETNAWKVNDRGEIVGSYTLPGGRIEGFLLRNGELTTFALPEGMTLSADNGGINARGDIVGKYCHVSPCRTGPSGHGFALTPDGVITIDVPGASGTSANAINARGDVTGGYFDAAGVLHGFITRLAAGNGAER